MRTFTAIVWIGPFGSSSKGGFDSYAEAAEWAAGQINRGVFGSRKDLRVEVVADKPDPNVTYRAALHAVPQFGAPCPMRAPWESAESFRKRIAENAHA